MLFTLSRPTGIIRLNESPSEKEGKFFLQKSQISLHMSLPQ